MKNRVRILQITYSLKAAGIETFVVNLYKTIDKDKFQFDFVSYFDKNCDEFYDDVVRQKGGIIYKLGFPERHKILNNIKIRFRLYKCIKINGYKIVHVHGSSGISILEVIIAKLAGAKRIIIHSHSSNVADDASFGQLQKVFTYFAKMLWNMFCSDFLSCSKKATEWLFTKKQSAKTEYIPNGILTENFCPNEEKYHIWRQKYNISDRQFLIGHVGSFTIAKNHPYIVRIFKNIKELNKNAKFVLIGDGPYRTEIESQIAQNNLTNQVILTGITDQVSEWMNACDVLILPSLYEGLPLACVEAQYTGTPIIVSDNITKEVAVSDDIYYLNINVSPSIWADKILSIKKTFAQTVHSNTFDIKSTAAKMEQIYLRGFECI